MTPPDGLVLLDTNVVVQYVRGSEVSKRIESQFQLRHRTERPLISVVSIGEMRALTRKFGWGSRKTETLENLLRELVVVDIGTREILEAYGEISHWTEARGQRMGQQNDMWIAATAHATDAHLITTDQDFQVLEPEWVNQTYIQPR